MSDAHAGFHGPWAWVVSSVAGVLLGLLLARLLPGAYEVGAVRPEVPLWLCAPFGLLLASIALMPFISARVWHANFPDFAFVLGGIVLAYYLAAYDRAGYEHGMSYGAARMKHAGIEFYAFIALVGGLFVVSGGVLVDVSGRGRPMVNTLLLAAGALLANVVGTTGASMLLIRPFMRINRGRLRPIHVVFFIFIVSNCGGCLTPIGDPPLYIGFLKGVPFFWSAAALWPSGLLVVGLLLAMFHAVDSWIERRHQRGVVPIVPPVPPGEAIAELTADAPGGPVRVRIRGRVGLACLVLMVVGVFVDPIIWRFTDATRSLPIGATLQIGVAVYSYRKAPREILEANQFSFFPVKEVGLLFLGIFLTMAPALGYLARHGARFGVDSPGEFYFAAGTLSAVLDNAPTYLNFMQVAFGPVEIDAGSVRDFLSTEQGNSVLAAISAGAVFFGAMTYIGNGPNFMVRSIAVTSGVRMPGFFGYLARAVAILLPVLVVHWLVIVR